jgi:hypothetical protein
MEIKQAKPKNELRNRFKLGDGVGQKFRPGVNTKSFSNCGIGS